MEVKNYVLKERAVLEAIQFTEETNVKLIEWVESNHAEVLEPASFKGDKMQIYHKDQTIRLEYGDWLVMGVTGTFFSMSDERFNNVYCPEEDIQNIKAKAEKWDNLADRIESYYVREDGSEIEEGDEDYSDDGLIGIGECAASAFGWLL